jgi:(2Fe-2S) ferredoxin
VAKLAFGSAACYLWGTLIYDLHIFVCCNQRTGGEKRSCGEAHGLELVAEFKKQLKDLSPIVNVRANRAGCLGICDFGPTVAIYPEGTFYVGVEKSDVREILEALLGAGRPVERLLLREKPRKEQPVPIESLMNEDIFRDFSAQLKKDFSTAGIEIDLDDIPRELGPLNKSISTVIASVTSASGKIGRLLNRVDIGDKQLRNYLEERPGLVFEKALAELVIKRILQKVVIRKKFSS